MSCRRIGAVVERTALLGDRLQGLIEFGILDWSREPLELDGLEIGQRDRRHDLHFDGVSEIGLAGDDALDGAFFRRQNDFGLGRKFQSALGNDL